MSEEFRGEPDRPFRPASGEEGEQFQYDFCIRCAFYQERWGCPLICQSQWNALPEPQYPSQYWVYGEQGQPICRAFVPQDDDKEEA